MTIDNLKEFFMWSSVINIGLLLLMVIMFTAARKFAVRMQRKFFKLPEEKIISVIYRIVAIYKLLIIVFNIVPYVVLNIMNY